MQQLINTVCFPPRRVLWQQPQDSLKSGQGSLSKVPLSPNNVTNSVLTWMLLQEVPEIGKITQLIKLAVRKPSAKCRDALPQQPWVCSPRGAQDLLGRRGSSHLPAPWAGVCSSGGTQGKNQLPTQDSWGAHGFPPGDSRAPRCPRAVRCWGGGLCVLCCGCPQWSLVQAGRGHPADVPPPWATLTECPHVGAWFLILPC